MVSRRRLKREKHVEEAVAKLAKFWATYDQQDFYRGYTDETIINDALYAIGMALWGHTFASGFDATCQRLLEHLQKEHRPPAQAAAQKVCDVLNSAGG